jgi:hypothetical protein
MTDRDLPFRRLGEAYSEFRQVVPPTDATQPDLDKLLDEILVYGADVAGIIERLLRREPVPVSFRYLLKFDENLVGRLTELSRQSLNREDIGLIEDARAYLESIQKLVADARELDQPSA